MDPKVLDETNECYDAERWASLQALAKGGKLFHARVRDYLPRMPLEPELRYAVRISTAKYYSYIGAIVNLYASWLFAGGFEAKAYKKGTSEPLPEVDGWYGNFQENVGEETTLRAFMKDRFREVLTTRKTVWLAQKPQATEPVLDRASYDAQGLGNVNLKAIDPSQLLDWEKDEDGNLMWAIVKTSWCERTSWKAGRNIEVQQWRIYDAETVTTFELRRDKTSKDKFGQEEAVQVGPAQSHGFKRIPLVILELPEEMCIGEQTHDAQLSHFQHDNALSWAIKLCCYPMPIWKLSDMDSKPTMGAGYAQFIGPDDELEWSSPPSDSFDVIARNRDSKRDEIFRIVHQMAQGLDNNAETVGRSADSKEIDAAATRIMLNAYGEVIGKAIEETYEMISEARDDADYEWSVEGSFSGFDTATVASLLANLDKAKRIGVPSNTFMREITKKGAMALLPELDPRVKDTVKREIDKYNFEPTGELIDQVLAEIQAKTQVDTTKLNTSSTEKQQDKQLEHDKTEAVSDRKNAVEVAKHTPKAPAAKK